MNEGDVKKEDPQKSKFNKDNRADKSQQKSQQKI